MAGAGYKLFNTGDVLTAAQVNTYLMQQTIMVFADSTARTTALSGVLAEGMTTYLQDTNSLEFWNGSAWVAAVGDITGVTAGTGLTGGGTSGTVTLTNDMAVTITAKGDLIAGTGNATYDNLAAGSNGDSLVADSAASTGLRWQGNYAAGKNAIINGDFRIWQRGTSFTPATDTTVYLADRFNCYVEGSGATRTLSQQTFTAGTAPVSGYEGRFFLRYAQSVGPSGAIGNNLLRQFIEDVRTFAGQTVTFSFWAKAASTITLPNVALRQYFGSGGSPSTGVDIALASNVSIGTSWTRYSYTVAVPSISGKTLGTNNDSYLEARLNFPLGAGNTFTFDTWGWQLEAGNVATAFQTATGTLQGEIALAQRYYYRAGGDQQYQPMAMGWGNGSSGAYVIVPMPVTMRVAPTAVDYANVQISDFIAAGQAVTNLVLTNAFNGRNMATLTATVASGLTLNRPYALHANNSTSAYVGLSAEL